MTADYQDQTTDETDPEAAVRRRVLAQQQGQGSDPSAAASAPSVAASTGASADPIAPAPFQAAPTAQAYAGDNYSAEPGTYGQPETSNTPPAQAASAYHPTAGNNDAGQVQSMYETFTGRQASEAEINAQLQGGSGDLGTIQNAIANSAEAQKFAARQTPTPTPTPNTGGGGGNGGGNAGGGTPANTTAQTFASVNSSTLPGNPFQDQMRQMILDRLRSAQAPVDPNAPEIASALSASSDALARQQKLQRSQTAERLYAQGGLQTDALGRNIQQSNERNATAQSGLKATLLMNAYNQKRTELTNLLQLAVSSGDADSARMVQLQLAALQAQIQREGIGANLAIAGQSNNNITVGSAA